MRMRLKLINQTNLNGRDLRRFIRRCMDEANAEADRSWFARIKYVRAGRNVHGHAWLNSGCFEVRIPRPKHPLPMAEFARVTIHEIGHCLGLRHGEMVDWWTIPVPWVEEYTIRKKGETTQEKPTEPLRVVRYRRALQNLATAETRLRRATTLAKKWRQKIRYYERALGDAAAAIRKETPCRTKKRRTKTRKTSTRKARRA